MKKFSAIALALGLASSATAGGQLTSDFKTADTNGDGKLSRAEFRAWLHPVFERMDADHSGLVTKSELRQFAMSQMLSGKRDPIMRGVRPNLEPEDHEGGVDFDRFVAAFYDVRFKPFDADQDGFLSPGEFEAMSQ